MNREDAKAEWKRAAVALGATCTLAINGYNNDAVSRAYYAILHAAKAGLATKGIDAAPQPGRRGLRRRILAATAALAGIHAARRW